MAGTLARLGPKAPLTLLDPSADNPRGFWESRLVVALNDEILQAGGSYWRDWQVFRSDRIEPAQHIEFQHKIAELLVSEFGNEAEIVLKDPRLCRLFPYWEQPLQAAGYRSVFVLPLRSPFEVAASLIRRNGMSTAECLLLWLRHVLEAEKLTRGRPRKLILWDDFIKNWRGVLKGIASEVQWSTPDLEGACGDGIDAFLSADLKHEHRDGAALDNDPESHVWLREAWRALNALAAGRDLDEAQMALDSVRGAMDVASDLYGRAFGPVLWEAHQANVRRDELAAAATALEQERTTLSEQNERYRHDIQARDVRIGELNDYGAVEARRADQAEGDVSLAQALLATCRAQLVEAGQRCEQQETGIAALEERVVELQRQLQRQADAAEVLGARLEAQGREHLALRADFRRNPIVAWWMLRKEKD